jgi:GNAT superfamily N-acetyltransferase
VVDLRQVLDLDSGYLSRILARLEDEGLVDRVRSAVDGRRQVVALTPAGRKEFRLLDRRSARELGALLSGHPAGDRRRLTSALATVRALLDDTFAPEVTIRAPASGEFGWMVERHGALYAEEYGWNEEFEGLVARIVADYLAGREDGAEDAWVAEMAGAPVGCVLCIRKDATTAQLRILLVEPHARGRGIGSALTDRCIEFARRAGYSRLVLWTNDVLRDARRIYERAGFELIEEEPHHSFGVDLVGQYWGRDL